MTTFALRGWAHEENVIDRCLCTVHSDRFDHPGSLGWRDGPCREIKDTYSRLNSSLREKMAPALNTTQLQEILGYLESLQEFKGMIEDMEKLNEEMDSQTSEIEDTRSISITFNVFILPMLILFSVAILLVLLRKPQANKDEGFE